MAIDEVFKNPTVKQVIFQIRFPHLFYIENRIAELQLKIMKEFTESQLRYKKIFSFGEAGPDVNVAEIEKNIREGESGQKMWTFRSPKNYELNIQSNSLDITSKCHKTYNLGDENKFRDVIDSVLGHFFEIVSVPLISRIGLRYIDECPIESKSSESFRSYYNSVLPLDRFNMVNALVMNFRVVTKLDKHFLMYAESLMEKEGKYILVLDFDGYAESIEPKDCMSVTDELHALISEEFEKTIKEPVKAYMRKEKEGEDA